MNNSRKSNLIPTYFYFSIPKFNLVKEFILILDKYLQPKSPIILDSNIIKQLRKCNLFNLSHDVYDNNLIA